MIVFKDEENDSVMSFSSSKLEPFYIEVGKIGEESYANCIELEDNEVQHLINVLTNHLKK